MNFKSSELSLKLPPQTHLYHKPHLAVEPKVNLSRLCVHLRKDFLQKRRCGRVYVSHLKITFNLNIQI